MRSCHGVEGGCTHCFDAPKCDGPFRACDGQLQLGLRTGY